MFRGENICNRFMTGWLTCWMNISIWKGFGIMWPAKNCRALIKDWRATLRRSRGGNRDFEFRFADFCPKRIDVGRRTLEGAAKC